MKNLILPEFQLVAERATCKGADPLAGYFKNVDDCATSCRDKAQMFAFGINTHGVDRCYHKDGCHCYCQTTTTNFQCNKQLSFDGYNLYSFQGKAQSIPKRLSLFAAQYGYTLTAATAYIQRRTLLLLF